MEQLPDGRWHWEPGHCRPLCYECESDADLWRYEWGGDWFLFCSERCANAYARRNRLEVDHDKRVFTEPYNGAAYGFSPYDMDLNECLGLDERDDYDCCDDAEDYGEDNDCAEND